MGRPQDGVEGGGRRLRWGKGYLKGSNRLPKTLKLICTGLFRPFRAIRLSTGSESLIEISYLNCGGVVESHFPGAVAEDVEHEGRKFVGFDGTMKVDHFENVDFFRRNGDICFDRKSCPLTNAFSQLDS